MICGPCGRAADYERACLDAGRRVSLEPNHGDRHCDGLGCMCQHKPIQPKDKTIKGENG